MLSQDVRTGISRRAALRYLGTVGGAIVVPDRVRAVETGSLPPVVLDWLGAWSSPTPSTNIAALYDDEGAHDDVPSGLSLHSPELASSLDSMLSGLGNVTRHLRGSFAIERLAMAEQLFTATNLGRYPAGRYGADFEVYAVTVFEIDGDRLRRTADYYDVASILSQLSAAPTLRRA